MRIVAGTAKGRTLATPKNAEVIRPTADRTRETIFNVLGQWCDGLTVLDCYAGTGALGLEAVSRGALQAVLIDSGREALGLCRQNIDALGFSAKVELVAAPVEKGLAQVASRGLRFELVFSDPPYKLAAGTRVLEQLEALRLVVEGGVVVVEHSRAEVLAENVGCFHREDERRFGDTVVSIFRLTPAGA